MVGLEGLCHQCHRTAGASRRGRPNARKVLEKLNAQAGGGMDLSKEALAFMEWKDGEIGGFNARLPDLLLGRVVL